MAQLPPIGAEVPPGQFPPLPPVGAEVSAQAVTEPPVQATDPNTIRTFANHLWSGLTSAGQLLPFPKALGGSGVDNPLWPPNEARARHAVKLQADALWKQGDKVGASAKYVESVIPLLGPMLSQWGDEAQQGKIAALAGDVGSFAATMKAGTAASGAAQRAYPLASRPRGANMTRPEQQQTPAQFGLSRGVPLDAATVSDNFAVKGVQQLADRSLGGSVVGTKANAARAAAMGRVGEELSTQAHPTPVTPEQAGTSIRAALTSKIAGHTTEANVAYEQLRALEEQPTNRITMPGKPTAPVPIDSVAEGLRGQLRRIVHEMDAAPYTPRLLQPAKRGGSLEHVEGTGGAGAKVFDDIVGRMSKGKPPRAAVQKQLESYLAGGPQTSVVTAALKVAEERAKGQGGRSVSLPELPPSANDVLTRLEAKRAPRVTGQEMGFPVDLRAVKQMLKPVYDQMRRQMPITQQQANPGLKAIQNILEGDDYAALSQVDRDLSAIKSVARQQGGLAKFAVSKLDAAVQEAASFGGPEVTKTLQAGRRATIAKYAASDVLDALHDEPVKTVRALTATKDSAIQQLRAVTQQVPEQAPVIARAYLEDLMEKPNQVAEWNKLGNQTKAILFPKEGHAQALDQFFALTNRISKANVNPSGSGYIAALGAQGAMIWYDPIHAVPLQISGAVMAKLLRSPAVVRALTRGASVPRTAPAAVRVAATAALIRSAREAGVDLGLPKAADREPTR